MRLGTLTSPRNDLDEVFQRFFVDPTARWGGAFEVPTDVFRTQDRLVIRLDLPGVGPDDVDLTVQESTLLINGKRDFPFDADSVRWMRRGTFYGDFTQRVTLGKGLDTDKISARFDNGVLEISIPYREEVQPRKIEIEAGTQEALQS